MATNTTNYNFKKPEKNDFYNIEDFNGNVDELDRKLKEIENKTITVIENRDLNIWDLDTGIYKLPVSTNLYYREDGYRNCISTYSFPSYLIVSYTEQIINDTTVHQYREWLLFRPSHDSEYDNDMVHGNTLTTIINGIVSHTNHYEPKEFNLDTRAYIQDNLNYTNAGNEQALSAHQGYILKKLIENLDNQIKKYTNLIENDDLDEKIENGIYLCSSGSIAETINNMPCTTLSSITIVEKVFNNIIMQTCVATNGSKMYSRRKYNNIWSDWTEYATFEDLQNLKNCKSISSNSSLNDYTEPGRYYVPSRTIAQTIENIPNSEYIAVLYVEKTGTNTMQIFITLNGEYTYVRRYYNNEWSSWIDYLPTKKMYPVGSIVINNTNVAPNFPGTWELINKEYGSVVENHDGSNISAVFHVEEENASVTGVTSIRNGNTLRLRLNFKVSNEAGVDVNIGKFENRALGFYTLSYTLNAIPIATSSNPPLTTTAQITTGSSSNNYQSSVMLHRQQVIPAKVTYYIDFTVPILKENMVDSFCDKFYWQRTA